MSLPNLPDVPRERRRTATVIAVGAFAVLCLLALVLGLKGLFAPADSSILTSSPPPQPSAFASTGAGATSSGAASPESSATSGSAPSDRVGFSSPSGNIRCEISSAGARCDVVQRGWKPPAKPASCSGDWGRGLQVSARGAFVVCSSDAVAGGQAVAYGGSVARGDFRCDSSKDGVTCVHRPSGHGFSVARASYRLR